MRDEVELALDLAFDLPTLLDRQAVPLVDADHERATALGSQTDQVQILLGDALARPRAKLTTRQREVLRLIMEGRRMKEIAAELHLSRRTVESHKYDMMHALGVRTTAELIQYVIRNELADS